jgi:hypothetical protein
VCAQEKLYNEEINNNVLLATDIAEMTAFHRAACSGEIDIMLKVC